MCYLNDSWHILSLLVWHGSGKPPFKVSFAMETQRWLRVVKKTKKSNCTCHTMSLECINFNETASSNDVCCRKADIMETSFMLAARTFYFIAAHLWCILMTAIHFYRQNGNLLTCSRPKRCLLEAKKSGYKFYQFRITVSFHLSILFLRQLMRGRRILRWRTIAFYSCFLRLWLLHFARHKALMWEEDMKQIGDILLPEKKSLKPSLESTFHIFHRKNTNLLWTVLCSFWKQNLLKNRKKIFKFSFCSFSFTHSPMNRKSCCAA